MGGGGGGWSRASSDSVSGSERGWSVRSGYYRRPLFSCLLLTLVVLLPASHAATYQRKQQSNREKVISKDGKTTELAADGRFQDGGGGVALLTTETYTDYVRVEGRVSLVMLFQGRADDLERDDGWLSKVVREGQALADHPLHMAMVDVSVDRMMVTLVPTWLRLTFQSRDYDDATIHFMLLRGDGDNAAVLARWTGMWSEMSKDVLRHAKAVTTTSPHVFYTISAASELQDTISEVSVNGRMIITAAVSTPEDVTLLEGALKEVARQWGARGTGVDQPLNGADDGILPTMVILPADGSVTPGEAYLKVIYAARADSVPAAEWAVPLASLEPQVAAADIMARILSLGCAPLIETSLSHGAVWTMQEGLITYGRESKTRYVGFIPCNTTSGMDPLSVPSVQSFLLSYRNTTTTTNRVSISWYCTSPRMMKSEAFWPKSAVRFLKDHVDGNEGAGEDLPRQITGAIFDTQSYWYTGPDVVLTFGQRVTKVDWSEKVECMKLEAAVEYLTAGEVRARAWNRKRALERLAVSVEGMIKWALGTKDEDDDEDEDEGSEEKKKKKVSSYSERDVKRIFRFMDSVGLSMEVRRQVADFIYASDLRSAKESQLAMLRRWANHDMMMPVGKEGEEAEAGSSSTRVDKKERKAVKSSIKKLSAVIAKHDRLCVGIKRGKVALSKVLEGVRDCCPQEYEELHRIVMGAEGDDREGEEECTTFLGYNDEYHILEDMKVKGPSLVPELIARLEETSHSLFDEHLQAAKDKGHDTFSLGRVYRSVLRRADVLQSRLDAMTEAGNRAARAYLQTQPQVSSWEVWPFEKRIMELPRRDGSTLTLEEFAAYAEDGTPVVITGLDMAPHGLWNLDFVKSTCGSLSLPVGSVKKQLRHMRAWGGFTTANFEPMTLGELIEAQVSHNATTEGWYMADESTQRGCAAAFGPPPFDGLRPPPFIATDYFQINNRSDGGYSIHGPSAFCGAKGTGTAVHEDAGLTEFWMYMHHGEKHWRMFKPVDHLLMYHNEDLRSFGPDVFDVNLDEYPLMAFADIFEVRLQPGELLFAPGGSIHAVRNTGEINYGVSTNYVDAWGMHFTLLHYLVLDSEDAIAYHMGKALKNATTTTTTDSSGSKALGSAGSDLRALTTAWQDQHHLGVQSPTTSVPYGVYRSQSRLYGRDKPLKDKLTHLLRLQLQQKKQHGDIATRNEVEEDDEETLIRRKKESNGAGKEGESESEEEEKGDAKQGTGGEESMGKSEGKEEQQQLHEDNGEKRPSGQDETEARINNEEEGGGAAAAAVVAAA